MNPENKFEPIADTNKSDKCNGMPEMDKYVVSPISITLLLSLLAYGLTGETLKELLTAIGIKQEETAAKLQELISLYTNLNSSGVVKVTNIVLSQPQLSESYIEKISQYSASEHLDITNIDATVQKINKYVSDNTNGLITKIVDKSELNSDVVTILMNTIYFKDKWAIAFQKELTVPKPFFVGTSSRQEQFMFNKGKKYNYYQSSTYQHMEMKYLANNFYFGLVLPIDKNSPAIQLLQHELIENVAKFAMTTIDLEIPKFTQETEIDLIPVLQGMGIKKLFTNAESNMFAESIPVVVSVMKQKAKIIVDEVGTEAAAITMAEVSRCMVKPQNSIKVVANHPFSYYVRYRDVVLFEGIYV